MWNSSLFKKKKKKSKDFPIRVWSQRTFSRAQDLDNFLTWSCWKCKIKTFCLHVSKHFFFLNTLFKWSNYTSTVLPKVNLVWWCFLVQNFKPKRLTSCLIVGKRCSDFFAQSVLKCTCSSILLLLLLTGEICITFNFFSFQNFQRVLISIFSPHEDLQNNRWHYYVGLQVLLGQVEVRRKAKLERGTQKTQTLNSVTL